MLFHSLGANHALAREPCLGAGLVGTKVKDPRLYADGTPEIMASCTL